MKHLFPRSAIIFGSVLLITTPAFAQRGGGSRGGGSHGGGSHGGGGVARSSGGHSAGRVSGGATAHVSGGTAAHIPIQGSRNASGRTSVGRTSVAPIVSVVPRGTTTRNGIRPSGVPSVFASHFTRASGSGLRGVPFTPVRGTLIARRPVLVPRIFSPFGIRHRFFFRNRFFGGPFFYGGGFGFSPCAQFGFWARDFFFANQFDCWGDPFFGPTFYNYGFPYGSYVAAPNYYTPSPDSNASSSSAEPSSAEAKPLTSPKETPKLTITWLQTKDGELFGLTDYWADDGRLYYVTDYGAKNSIPLDQIDLDKTVELNAKQGIEFVLRRKPPQN